MADDRLDDAIDAVVRAVDRIERATRTQRVPAEGDASVVLDEADVAVDLQPPVTNVAPGRDAWDPEPAPHRKKDKSKKKRRGEVLSPGGPVTPPAATSAPDRPTTQPAVAPTPPPTASMAAGGPPAAEVHELVGHIVVRTQELDDHLEAARALRAEILALVSRLATATGDER